MDARTLCSMVDHTLLKPESTQRQIEELCAEADQLQTRTVCVNGFWVPVAARALRDSPVDVCAVVGFPLGAMSSLAVGYETATAIEDGATEIDMVIPIGQVRAGAWSEVETYISRVQNSLPTGVSLKVILEIALLAEDEIRRASQAAAAAGAAFVKTSTGFSSAGGASLAAVALMRATVGPHMGVKAAGGIRTLDQALAMLEAGASRLGLSSTVAIAAELDARG